MSNRKGRELGTRYHSHDTCQPPQLNTLRPTGQ